jgi:hypothetical protein
MNSESILTAARAAEMLYNTAHPTPEEVRKVCEKIARGALRRSPRGGWTTTTDAVAQYLAQKSAAQAALPGQRAQRAAGKERLPGLYCEWMHDYVLAILLRRTQKRRSLAFNYAVAAMQIALILLPIMLIVLTYQSAQRSLVVSPERRAVEERLEEEFSEHQILAWNDVSHTPRRVRVRFWYRSGKTKRIESTRDFTIADGKVTNVEMPE